MGGYYKVNLKYEYIERDLLHCLVLAPNRYNGWDLVNTVINVRAPREVEDFFTT
jgi:hypothetical protein